MTTNLLSSLPSLISKLIFPERSWSQGERAFWLNAPKRLLYPCYVGFHMKDLCPEIFDRLSKIPTPSESQCKMYSLIYPEKARAILYWSKKFFNIGIEGQNFKNVCEIPSAINTSPSLAERDGSPKEIEPWTKEKYTQFVELMEFLVNDKEELLTLTNHCIHVILQHAQSVKTLPDKLKKKIENIQSRQLDISYAQLSLLKEHMQVSEDMQLPPEIAASESLVSSLKETMELIR